MRGNSTVIMETEKMPKGSWKKTSALLSAEALPSSRPLAKSTASCSVVAKIEAESQQRQPRP